jgi:hypothetical protein
MHFNLKKLIVKPKVTVASFNVDLEEKVRKKWRK